MFGGGQPTRLLRQSVQGSAVEDCCKACMCGVTSQGAGRDPLRERKSHHFLAVLDAAPFSVGSCFVHLIIIRGCCMGFSRKIFRSLPRDTTLEHVTSDWPTSRINSSRNTSTAIVITVARSNVPTMI